MPLRDTEFCVYDYSLAVSSEGPRNYALVLISFYVIVHVLQAVILNAEELA